MPPRTGRAHVGDPARLDQGEGVGDLVELVGRHAERRAAQVVGEGLDHEGVLPSSTWRTSRRRRGSADPCRTRRSCRRARPGPGRSPGRGGWRRRWRYRSPGRRAPRRRPGRGPLERLGAGHGDDADAPAGGLLVVRGGGVDRVDAPGLQPLDDQIGGDLGVDPGHGEAQAVLLGGLPGELGEVVDAPVPPGRGARPDQQRDPGAPGRPQQQAEVPPVGGVGPARRASGQGLRAAVDAAGVGADEVDAHGEAPIEGRLEEAGADRADGEIRQGPWVHAPCSSATGAAAPGRPALRRPPSPPPANAGQLLVHSYGGSRAYGSAVGAGHGERHATDAVRRGPRRVPKVRADLRGPDHHARPRPDDGAALDPPQCQARGGRQGFLGLDVPEHTAGTTPATSASTRSSRRSSPRSRSGWPRA